MAAKARTSKPAPTSSAPTVTMADVARSVFSTQDGQRLLDHLDARFGLNTRVFLPNPDNSLCPLRAAVRDGERAAIAYLHALIDSATGKLNPPRP
jgi:hypothetical protein